MKKLFIFTFLAFFSAATFYSEGEGGITEKKKVLFLSSYSMKEEAVMLQINGLTSILPDDKYEISYEFMDSRRFNSTYDTSLFTIYLRSKLTRQTGFDCIITGGDEALSFMCKHPTMRGDSPIIYFGIQDPNLWNDVQKYNFMTGISGNPDFSSNIKFATSLFPSTNHLVFITDSSREGLFDEKKIAEVMENHKKFSYEILNLTDTVPASLKSRLEALEQGSVVFLSDIYLSHNRTLNSLQKTAFDICSVCKVPVFCAKTDLTESGVIGGCVTDNYGSARIAADIAKHVMSGTDVSKVHRIAKSPQFSVADKNVLDSFKISTFSLPADTVIKNHYKSFFERYRIAIFAIGLFFVALAYAFIYYFRRSITQKRLLETDNKIFRHTAFESTDYIAVADVKENTATLLYGSWFGNESELPESMRKINLPDLINIFAEKYVAPETRQKFIEVFQLESILPKIQAAKNGKYVFSGNFVRPDGSSITKQFSYSFLDQKKGIVLSYRTDITQSVREEQEANERLRRAVTVAQKANEAKTQFLSRISHDIRTPIGAILNLTDFAKKDMDNKQSLNADLDKIATSGRFLLSLINDVLDISKIDSDKIELNKEPYSFIDYIKEIRNIILPMCTEKNIFYKIITQNDSAEVVMLDKIRVNQITLNLLSNAVKYTPPGGTVTLRVSAFARSKADASDAIANAADAMASTGTSANAARNLANTGTSADVADAMASSGTSADAAANEADGSSANTAGTSENATANDADGLASDGSSANTASTSAEPAANEADRADSISDLADIEISVTDTGIGMSDSFQSVMFDDFSQEEDNPLRAKEIQGTGLGLAIVKRLVDLMGGTISVRSILGKGSSIKVRWTGKIVHEDKKEEDLIQDLESGSQKKVEGTILLAEDNEINAAIACRIFEEIGVSVDLASNGDEEVKKFAASPVGKYIAIFTDIQMPVMDGYEATEKIRSFAATRPDAKTIPIIAMTANAYPEAAVKATNCGMTDFTTKPLDSARLRKILEVYANKKESE
ncbi:MAG: response regulator [Treponema sp.]|nr:response regulator [Treponema sp.]